MRPVDGQTQATVEQSALTSTSMINIAGPSDATRSTQKQVKTLVFLCWFCPNRARTQE